jgi:hypothetical protein
VGQIKSQLLEPVHGRSGRGGGWTLRQVGKLGG